MKHGPAEEKDALTEHWFFRVLIAGVVLAVIFYVASYSLTDVVDEVGEYKAQLMTDRFAKSVGHIHQEWDRQGKPSVLKLNYYETQVSSKTVEVHVNSEGWPLTVDEAQHELNCSRLWLYFAETNTDKETLVSVSVTSNERYCDYSWTTQNGNKRHFIYDSDVGLFEQERQ